MNADRLTVLAPSFCTAATFQLHRGYRDFRTPTIWVEAVVRGYGENEIIQNRINTTSSETHGCVS